MLVKILPAKTLGEGSDRTRYSVPESQAVEFFVPDLAFMGKYLSDDANLTTVDDEKAAQRMETFGIPTYKDDLAEWTFQALLAMARRKADSSYEVIGDDPEDLKVRYKYDPPTDLDGLLERKSKGSAYMSQKKEFLTGFVVWLRANEPKAARATAAFARPSFDGIPQKAKVWCHNLFTAYVNTLDEETSKKVEVYIRAADHQLTATDAADDWDDLPELDDAA